MVNQQYQPVKGLIDRCDTGIIKWKTKPGNYDYGEVNVKIVCMFFEWTWGGNVMEILHLDVFFYFLDVFLLLGATCINVEHLFLLISI